MTDKTPTTPEVEKPTPGAEAEVKPNDFSTLPDWAQRELRDARKEAAKYREGKLEAEKAAKAAEDTRLAEQQKWQELAEKRAKELEGLQPVRDRLTALETAFSTALQKRLEAIPEQYKPLVPDFSDPVKTWDWLDKNQSLFATRLAPPLDGGVQGDGKPKSTRKLTDAEMALAKNAGMKPEDYLAQLIKREART